MLRRSSEAAVGRNRWLCAHTLTTLLYMIVATTAASAQGSMQTLSVMPYPAHVETASGEFAIDSSLSIALTGYSEPRLERAVQRFLTAAQSKTGIPFQHTIAKSDAKLVIHCDHKSEPVQKLGEDESYSLEVTATAIHLNGPTPLGAMHGLETLSQMITAGHSAFVVPAVKIDDRPRFPWRGLLLDAGRHWMPVEVVHRELDGMAAVKMNVLHWHLSEDQGFRIESKKYPKLQEMGSDGNYYTQDQVREVLEYARDRGIRVVPEFDMPGHTTAWFVGYPELASGPGPYQIERSWGIFDPAMDPTKESTYSFLDGFIEEMTKLFPDEYFHVGGDEVNGKQWSANENIKKFMAEHKIKDNEELQTYFATRLQKIVEKHHKTMVGWDEVFHPGLPKDVVIESWRGPEALAAAARQGYRGMLANGYYLDLNFPAATHYAADPLGGNAAGLSEDEKKRVLGGEACMWSEFVTPENIDSRLWPRAAAVAERLWSPQPDDLDSMYRRLSVVTSYLSAIGMKHETNRTLMFERIADGKPVEPLKTVASVLEPVKEYKRGQTANYAQQTPLNRVIDAIPPESLTARDFTARVKRVTSHTSTHDDQAELRQMLTTWRDNDAKFKAAQYDSFLAQELAPVSAQLSQIAAIGLEALDKMSGGSQVSDCTTKLAQVTQATQATRDLLNQVAAPIGELLRAAGCGETKP
jgi:hexosaminidase